MRAATKIRALSTRIACVLLLSFFYRSFVWRLLAVALALSAVGMLEGRQHAPPPTPPQAVWPTMVGTQPVGALQRVAKGNIPMPVGMAAAHASSLLVMPPNHAAALSIFWFSGDRESGPNVQIAASQYERATQQWTPPRFVVNRQQLGAQLGFGVRRLGNPVVWLDGRGRMHLFVVATGAGGWAAARVLHLRQSSDNNALDQLAFEPVRMLPLSWLWNTSFLVRNAPLPLADGGMVLPVHFELGIKYPVALRFDKEGEFLGLVRVSVRPYLLQPTLLMQSPQSWLALMRDARTPGKIGAAHSADGGHHWHDLPDLALDNPDSAVAGMGVAPGSMLLAHNSSPGTRATLDLSQSADGREWLRVHTLESGAADDEFSYPAMAWVDGQLWISYTVDRHRIAWQRFAADAAPTGRQP